MKKRLLFLLFLLFSFGAYSQSVKDSVYICVSQYAKVYHAKHSCSGLGKCTHEVRYISKDDAIKTHGRRSCNICTGSSSSSSSSSPSYKSSGTQSVQCSGTTQKGARCKRMTTSASGRCYQH